MQSHTLYTKNLVWADIKLSAMGRWHYILATVGIEEQFLRKKHGPCPICGGKDRFRFDDKNGSGTFYCNSCGAGDGFKLIQIYRNCSPKESLYLVADVLNCKEIAQIPQRSYTTIKPEMDQKLIQANREQLQKTWNEAKKITPGDPVHKYLTLIRKLPLVEIPPVLRIHPELAYWEDKNYIGTFPVMLAKIENVNGEQVGLHRTYLTSHGQKAPVPKPKKFMSLYQGALTGAAIRLYEPTDTLILGEGIETSIAGFLCLELPAWACRCDQGLAAIKLPHSVRKVIALVDNDESRAGQQAAEKLAHRMILEGRQIKRLMPEQLGKDWLDILTDEINR